MRYFGQPRRFGMPLGTGSGSRTLAQRIAAHNPALWLRLAEMSDSIAKNAAYTAAPGAELLTNGDFSAWTADDPDSWTVMEAGDATSNVTESPSETVNIISDLTATHLIQSGIMTLGDTYRSVVDVAAVDLGSIRHGCVGGSQPYETQAVGLVGEYSFDLLCTNTGYIIGRNSACDVHVASASLKKVGQLDGLYVGPTLNGDTLLGLPTPTFDGVNDYVQLEHNRLETLLKPENASFEMTFGIAFKMTQADIQDGNIHTFFTIGVDDNNAFRLYSNTGNDQFTFLTSYAGNHVAREMTTPQSSNYGAWVRMFGTVNVAQDRVRLYFNGTQIGTDASLPAGTWTASNLTSTYTRIGQQNGLFAKGSLGQALIFDRELTANEIAILDSLFKQQEPNAA